jgi:hypothetical protein
MSEDTETYTTILIIFRMTVVIDSSYRTKITARHLDCKSAPQEFGVLRFLFNNYNQSNLEKLLILLTYGTNLLLIFLLVGHFKVICK